MLPQTLHNNRQIEKLGNGLIFLCNNLEKASKTHLLKLVYIIEEISIKKFGIPFFNLDFYLWHLGPVNQDLYVQLSESTTILEPYITTEPSADGKSVIVKAKREFSDAEFSDNEIALLESIIDRFKHCTAKELINHTHKKDSLWYNTAVKNGLWEVLESGQKTTTEIQLDLSELIRDNPNKLNFYNSHKEFLKQSKALKS